MSSFVNSVSVVISTRDRPQLLRRAINSITSQEFDGDLEIILCFDQCEPDYTLEESNDNHRIVVTHNGRTPGLAGGRNSAIDKASYEWIAYCDDDDEWLPGKLKKQMDLLKSRPDSKACFTGVYVWFNGKDTLRVPDEADLTFEGFLRNRTSSAAPVSFVVHKQTLLDEIGLVDEEIPGGNGEDYDLFLRTAKATKISVVPEPLARVYWHGASFFFERWKMIDESLEYLINKHPEFQDHPTGLARIRGQQAIAKAASKNRSGALKSLAEAAKLNPREKRLPFGLLALAGLNPNHMLKVAHRFGRGI